MKTVRWLSAGGASPDALRELVAAVGPLPQTYLDLLACGDGGEVSLSVSPFTLCLDSAEDALSYWKSGTYTEMDVFVFGGNGGGILLAFYIGKPDQWPVVEFDPIDAEGSMKLVTPDLESLLELVQGHEA
jgi:hypothetical protein